MPPVQERSRTQVTSNKEYFISSMARGLGQRHGVEFPLTVDRVAEDDGLVHLQLREERVQAMHLLPLQHKGVELRDTLSHSTFIHTAIIRAASRYTQDSSRYAKQHPARQSYESKRFTG